MAQGPTSAPLEYPISPEASKALAFVLRVGLRYSWRRDNHVSADATAYRSAEQMLERLRELREQLSTPHATWPNLNRVGSPGTPGRTIAEVLQAELADIVRCLHAVRLSRDERRILNMMYRERGRYCRQCRRIYPTTAVSCVRCHTTTRSGGFVWEPYPTINVLLGELNTAARNGDRWSYQQVYRLRGKAYDELERAMRRRGMLS